MPALSAFTALLGRSAGRLAAGAPGLADGQHAFVLGSHVPGRFETLSVGDYIEVKQVVDLSTGESYVRPRVHFRPPAEMPAGVFWRFVVLRDNVEVFGFDFDGAAAREFTATDIAIPLIPTVPTREHLAFRLELGGVAGDYKVELPAFYVDGVLLDTQLDRPTIINRLPGPGETGVPIFGQPIRFEISDPDASASFGGNIRLVSGGLGTQPTRVYVDGVLAYDGDLGGFQAGFDGAQSAVVNGQRLASFTIDPTVSLASQATVAVRVETSGAWDVTVSIHEWSFVTADFTAPLFTAALAVARRIVRVTVSEELLAASSAGANDALNPALWSVRVASTSLDDGLPAVAPTVTAVAAASGNVFDLLLDVELTPLARYRVEVGEAYDLAGNPFVAPSNVVDFYGFQPTTPEGRDFDLLGMLPDLNVNEDHTRDLERFIRCYQEVLDQLLADVDAWTDILDPDIAPERFLDAMLADMGNPFAFTLSEIDKRRLLRLLVPIYRSKGTDQGIIAAVRFFTGIEITIAVPAFDAPWLLGLGELGGSSLLGTDDLGDRLSFWIVSPVVLNPDARAKILGIARYMKRAETYLLGIQEPEAPPTEPDHWALGLSRLGADSLLH